MPGENFFSRMFRKESDGIENIPDNSLNPEEHLLAEEEARLESENNTEEEIDVEKVKKDSGIDIDPKKYWESKKEGNA